MTESVREQFFGPALPSALGYCRALFFFWCLVQTILYQPWRFSQLPSELWYPNLLLMGTPEPALGTVRVLTALLILSLVLSTVGLWTRWTTASSALLLTYVHGVSMSYGGSHFHLTPLIIIAWIFPFSRCGDGFSLDRKLSRTTFPPSGEYRWPIKLASCVLVVLMFGAGLSKLLGGWLVDPANPLTWVLLFKYYAQASQKAIQLPSVVLVLVQFPFLVAILAVTTVLLEFGCPLALNDRWPRVRLVFIGGLFLMQLSLAALSTLKTFPWLGAYLFFLPWPSLQSQEVERARVQSDGSRGL